ncbi:MAG: LPS export ABC transporter periplasmic protein LptC [Rikenellaceae bacterium]
MVALQIFWSAILLFSCAEEKTITEESTDPNLMTQQSEDLTIINSSNGELSYHFETPLLERYDMANEPYMEFRKGVKMITFNDSTRTVESTLVANYAIFYEKRELWEAKGDVVVVNAEGDKLETQQLFWNQTRKVIYSNVDSKVTQGEDVMYGIGFESDETFTDFEFRKPRGRVEVDVEPMPSDSLAVADTLSTAAPSVNPATSSVNPIAPSFNPRNPASKNIERDRELDRERSRFDSVRRADRLERLVRE